MGYIYESLKNIYSITAYFYNPNIAPKEEYNNRLLELKKFAKLKNFDVIEAKYDLSNWIKNIKPLRYYGEKSERCYLCYKIRLEETFKYAKSNNYDIVTTALTISPHKNAKKINKIGLELQEKYSVEFLVADFKKNDGFKNSVEYSRKHNFYRQDYCGCVYSKKERDKNSVWYSIFKEENYKIKLSFKS